jgi:HEAT repeat protein/Na+-transporting methylmalonyl-CoA/oxaloacetate decarboxylase gamma subunit
MMKVTHKTFLHGAARVSAGMAITLAAFCQSAFAQAAAERAPSGGGLLDIFVNYYGLTIVFIVLLVAAIVYRKMTASKPRDMFVAKAPQRVQPQTETRSAPPPRKQSQPAAPAETDRPHRPHPPHSDAPAQDLEKSAFGAYRIDQEVGKLVLGKAHRMDVMSSRVADDRRAIEASLIKALGAPDVDEFGRERARQALEEYGFVARQSAIMLQGRDAWERSSAARVLGQIGSPASLTSLVEALHDNDSIVRNQAVTSLGQLKQPAAIGALLDIARRHSDIPPNLLSQSLSACSVDSLGYLDSLSIDLNEPHTGADGEPQDLEPLSVEALPMGDDDDAMLGLLTKLESSDVKERAQVARELGMHQSQRAVSALCETAQHDTDPSVRSAAVTALGSIDHQSVFAPVLVALNDETREVRAAAARTMSGLHFDRADAYARIIEIADDKTLQEVARACVQTGIVAQAIDRLASEDRRQSHEAFTLFSLLAKAGEAQPILDVIGNHKDFRVRLFAVRVLNVAGRADAAPALRDLVAAEGMPEDVRTSILEVLYKMDNEPAVV